MTASIAFATLFLGLVSGNCTVELQASPAVAAIVLALDGRPVARLSSPPWRGQVDFGPALLPHELSALALDGNGQRLGEARQLVNVARPPAEVELLVEPGEQGEPHRARLLWGSLRAAGSASIEVLLDGRPLSLGEGHIALLPPLKTEEPHVLSARLSFGPALSARTDVAIGGAFQDTAGDELTAVLVTVSEAGATAEELAPRLRVDGRPTRVVAVERGASSLFFVRSPAADGAHRSLRGIRRGNEKILRSLNDARFIPADGEYRRYEARLAPDDRFRFLWPVPSVAAGASLPTRLFDASHEYGHPDGGLLWFLSEVEHPSPGTGTQRWADAVAVAGLQALASQKRRAVVLVLGDEAADPSLYDPRTVREYLASIRVPLFVWSLTHRPSPLAQSWGLPIVDISSPDRLRRAAKELAAALARQRIAWVPGLHLPTAIAIAATL